MSTSIDRAIDAVESAPYGPDSARRIRRLTNIVDAYRDTVPAMRVVAALTDRKPARLLSYERALSTLSSIGTEYVDGCWLSSHALWN